MDGPNILTTSPAELLSFYPGVDNQAVLAGHSVLFRSAAALLEELHRQTPEGRHRKLRTYANVGLLCVDEVGYLYLFTVRDPRIAAAARCARGDIRRCL